MSEDNFTIQTQRLANLLEEIITIYKEDRKIAEENYNMLNDRLKEIWEMTEMSMEGSLESETNKALKLLMDSSKRLDQVINTLTRLITTQLNNQSKEKIAQQVFNEGDDGKDKTISKQINVSSYLENIRRDEN